MQDTVGLIKGEEILFVVWRKREEEDVDHGYSSCSQNKGKKEKTKVYSGIMKFVPEPRFPSSSHVSRLSRFVATANVGWDQTREIILVFLPPAWPLSYHESPLSLSLLSHHQSFLRHSRPSRGSKRSIAEEMRVVSWILFYYLNLLSILHIFVIKLLENVQPYIARPKESHMRRL